jgi:hypothetical protein
MPWMFSHASYPTPLALRDGRIRVFFSPRDASSRSSITFLDLDISGERFSIANLSREPLLSPGQRGAFDDGGVTVSCVIAADDEILVYYLGWSVSVTVPFRNFIGAARGHLHAEKFQRMSPAPIIDRSAVDPFTLGYPWVLRTGSHWQMWYGSHLEWGAEGLSMQHVIKTARSTDGLKWDCRGDIAIPVRGGSEFAVSRPCVLRDADCYRMWYARREEKYQMGYAESADGVIWHRRDETVAFVGAPGDWESESAEYATIFDHDGHRYMLYNGNGYGRTGFGLAVLEN